MAAEYCHGVPKEISQMNGIMLLYLAECEMKARYVGFENGTIVCINAVMMKYILGDEFMEYIGSLDDCLPEITATDNMDVCSKRFLIFDSVYQKSFKIKKIIEVDLYYIVWFEHKFGVNLVPRDVASTKRAAAKIAIRNRLLDYIIMEPYVLKTSRGKYFFHTNTANT